MQKSIDVLAMLQKETAPTNFLYEMTLFLEKTFTIAERVNKTSYRCFKELRSTFNCIRALRDGFGLIDSIIYLLQSPEKKEGFRYDCTQIAAGKKSHVLNLFNNIVIIFALDIPGICSFLRQHQIVNCELSTYANIAQGIGNVSIYGRQPFQILTKMTGGQAITVSLIIIYSCSALQTLLKEKKDDEKAKINLLKRLEVLKEEKKDEEILSQFLQKSIEEMNKEMEEKERLSNKTWYQVSMSVATAAILTLTLIQETFRYIPDIGLTKHTIFLLGKLKFF